MAKKRANRRENDNASVNVSRTALDRVYNQVRPDQKSRRTKNKRIEFVLNPAYVEDRNIIVLLGDLRGGDKSDYIRESLALKMEADQQPPIHELFEDMMQTISTLNQTIEDLRDEIASLKSGISIRAAAAVEVKFGSQSEPEPANVVQSGGISMDRPRPRPKIARTEPAQIAAPDVPEEMTEAEIMRNTKLLVDSIKKAQPGRGI